MCYSFKQKIVVAHNSKAIACELNCNGWQCKECCHKRKKAWMERFDLFSSLAVYFQITFCEDEKARNALTQRLNRNGVEFATIRVEDSFEVVHTPIPGNRQYKPDRSTWMTYGKMLANVRMIVDRAVQNRLPIRITTSRGFPKTPVKPKKWVLVTKTPISIEEMNRRLARNFEESIYLGVPFSASKIAALIGDDFELSRLQSSLSTVQEKISIAIGATAVSMVADAMQKWCSQPAPIGITSG